MPNFIKTFAISTALISTATFAPIQAHAEFTTLGECYQAVINWCSETFPDQDCSQTSGLDDCDEVFGNSVGGIDIKGIFATQREDETYSLRFEILSEPEEIDDRREASHRPTDEPRYPTGASMRR
ncbi:hypothetical protein [Yoonia sp. I 8.24]|uniref:hypothetical protein n=1 Tax=Yoonia sp. I 8.24 TaxID=1537229 RepID=UPI001EE049F1|nr:hypothetical protein [Yoonia sp. I 8.24]MCG3268266.1 hypothetical protein [Yoonia sp. I 8.24]